LSGNEIVVGLDVGTSKVRAIIGEIGNGTLNIVGVGTADSEGIRKGSIVDIDLTVKSIRQAIEHAERMIGVGIADVYVGITGHHIALLSSKGVVAVSNEDREIGEEDVERVLQAAKVVALPPEREIVGIVPRQYLVDGLDGIQDPRGMIGVRLEVEATLVTGAKTAIHNLVRCVERAGVHVAGLVLTPLAEGQLALSRDEKTVGVVLVDIGAGTTTISVFEEGHLAATSTLPVGGDLITSDIAYGLKTRKDVAEKIKLKYGCALVELADGKQLFKAARIGDDLENEYSQVELAHIIEPRVLEMFQLIAQEVRRLGVQDPPGGFVLTGGAVSLPGMLAAAGRELGASVRIAMPDYVGVRDPSYTGGVGIIRYVAGFVRPRSPLSTSKRPVFSRKSSRQQTATSKPGVLERFKNWISDYI